LATLGSVIATQTGLGSGFIGATLLAAATSLPEISTTTTAVREGNISMAFSNVFGSNSFDLLLLFPVSILAVQTSVPDCPRRRYSWLRCASADRGIA
jgi:cation:H+ antiporter